MTKPDAIVQYIREHERSFTTDAINATLQSAGHDQGAIDAAWDRYRTEEAGRRRPGTASKFGAVVLGAVVVIAYGFSALLTLVLSTTGGLMFPNGGQAAILFVYAMAILGGLVYSLKRLARAPSSDRAVSAIATAFAISVAIFIGLSGLCVAALASATGRG